MVECKSYTDELRPLNKHNVGGSGRPLRIKILVNDPYLIEYYEIHAGAVCHVNEVMKCGDFKIMAVVSAKAPRNGHYKREIIRIRQSECRVIE